MLRESAAFGASGKDEGPHDMEAFRVALVRRIRTLLGDARRCREPVCRRLRRCAGPDMRCQREQPAPPVSDEEWARVKAEFRRMLEQRRDELGV